MSALGALVNGLMVRCSHGACAREGASFSTYGPSGSITGKGRVVSSPVSVQTVGPVEQADDGEFKVGVDLFGVAN
jgi:hypothetical protein